MKIAFLGLGTMGSPMAGHLADKTEHQVCVFNRTHSKAIQWAEQHNGTACSLREAVSDSQVILMCLGRDEDVLGVVDQPDFIDHIMPNTVVVDHTTTSFELTQTLQTLLAKKQCQFIDAPVSGGADGAIKGQLTTMLGGDAKAVAAVEDILSTYCANQTHMGGVGTGQLAKMANQICITGILSGLSEAITFAEAQQLDVDKMLAAISGGAAQSWQMVNRGSTMHQRQFDFGFAIEWLIKDLGYCLAQGNNTNANLPTTQVAFEKYQELAAQGFHREDSSAMIRWYDEKND